MAARIGILGFERLHQRVHPFEKNLLDAPRLDRHPRLQVLLIAFVFENEPAFVQRLAHPRPHFIQMEGLGHIVERAELQAGDGALHFRHRRHHDHRGVGPAYHDFAQQCDAVHLRHPQVRDDERHGLRLKGAQRLDARPRLRARESLVLEQPHQHPPQARLVVHDETLHTLNLGFAC